MQPYIIFFRGLNGLIDEAAAERLAKNRGCEAVFFHWNDFVGAVHYVISHPEAAYHAVGFSRGAAPDVMGGFMQGVRAAILNINNKLRLPEDLMTVGLYGPIGGGFTPRYADPHFECINFLDESSQRHVGERNAVNLGADVRHLPQSKIEKPGDRGGMAIVADMFADGKNPLLRSPPQTEVASPAIALPKMPLPETPARSVALFKQNWPTQAQAPAFYGKPGSGLVHVQCPWTLRMDKVTLHQIQIHQKCAASLERVLNWVWESCGKDQEKIVALRYDRFSGSYADRPIRGGVAKSMHAYGAAIDWDDQDNQQHSHKHLFTAESPLIKAFLDEGWEWGGNWSGSSIDAMHVQAARVR